MNRYAYEYTPLPSTVIAHARTINVVDHTHLKQCSKNDLWQEKLSAALACRNESTLLFAGVWFMYMR